MEGLRIPFPRRWATSLAVATALMGANSCRTVSAELSPPVPGVRPGRVIQLANGNWFDGQKFVQRTLYSAGGILASRPPARVDSVIDLQGGYVIPPFAEAHNHNIDGDPVALNTKYLSEGVFYAQNPMNVLRARDKVAGSINIPRGIDATFSNAGLTGPGGHPTGLYLRNLSRGAMLPSDTNSTAGFLWTIADQADLDRKWPLVLASKPDFIKTLLLYSEEYDLRKNDSTYFNWRGLDPKLLPEIVRRSRAAGLRVMTHVETAADFHNALVAGADQIGHLPGFRGDEKTTLPNPSRYEISDADAALAARNGTFVITTVGDAQSLSLNGADSSTRRGLDALAARNLAVLKRHRVRIAVGSDTYRRTSLYEADYLNALGVFTPAELLRTWTETTANAIFPDRKIGKLEPGYEASFLVLEGDPLASFDNVKRIRLRVKQGEILQIPAR